MPFLTITECFVMCSSMSFLRSMFQIVLTEVLVISLTIRCLDLDLQVVYQRERLDAIECLQSMQLYGHLQWIGIIAKALS